MHLYVDAVSIVAYVDPTTGGILIQMLLGGSGVMILVRLLRGRVRALFRRQPRLAFSSDPYEWPFGLLKRAALFHLDILRTALEAGLIVKDSSAYNVQFEGTRPVFIDLGSFARLEPGTPWRGYAQFCAMF